MHMYLFSQYGRIKKKKWLYNPPASPSFPSAFITSVSDQARASVSIKLCSLRDDIYVRGQLIFSHCNYSHRSVKHKRSCYTPSSCSPANQFWPAHRAEDHPEPQLNTLKRSNKSQTPWKSNSIAIIFPTIHPFFFSHKRKFHCSYLSGCSISCHKMMNLLLISALFFLDLTWKRMLLILIYFTVSIVCGSVHKSVHNVHRDIFLDSWTIKAITNNTLSM